MTRTLLLSAQRMRGDQRGFSLVELLVVILIIGVLAAIAIPLFISHTKRSEDGEAKANARNLAAVVELCFTPNEDFEECDTGDELGSIGVPYGDGPGQARVVEADETTYKIESVSKAESDGSKHKFTLQRNLNGQILLTCAAGEGNDAGGCNNGEW